MPKTPDTKLKEIEREYVIPLRHKTQKVPRYKRANKAVKTIREFLVRHMRIRDRDLNKIKLDKYLNEFLWFRGIKKPPAKIKVKAKKNSEGIVTVELAEFPDKLKFKKLREDKKTKEAEEKKSKKKEKEIEEKAESAKEAEEKVGEDKKTKEAEEKKAAVAEAGKERAKQKAKESKHMTKMDKTQKQTTPKRKALAK
ncbi:50S ribosomal protein L31e [Candidatus Pacearchaeota archaeon]|nr:50S ribosomal protein L31e [Candidatus Pacearchaeota archaeon]